MANFSHLGISSPKIFIPFVPLGFPDRARSLKIIMALIEGGADMLELGFPFSDPIADGSLLQEANHQALRAGIDSEGCFALLQEIRARTQLPIGLLLYYNLLYRYGLERFCHRCADLDVQTLLIADLPLEEAEEYCKALGTTAIKSVFIVSERSGEERLRHIVSLTSGYLYLVSQPGVTGIRKSVDAVIPTLQRLQAATHLPICVGFGISQPAQVAQLSRAGADGIICGSALIQCINQQPDDQLTQRLQQFLRNMRAALID